jgi:azurin
MLFPLRLALVLLALTVVGCVEPAEPSPEHLALFAQDVDAELVVPAVKNAMRYATTRIEAPAGATVRLVMDNTGTTSPAMVHNVVVLRAPSDVQRVGLAAATAPDNIPTDPAILVHTPLTGPGERRAVVFKMPPAGAYPFICTWPGHFATMQGTLVSTAP